MSKSPGHQKWPNHKVEEQHLAEHIRVEVGGEVVAESDDVIKVVEDNHPARYYFPRADVRMDKLERSDTTTTCPFKGLAHYFTLVTGKNKLEDAVWTYEEPYDEHAELRDRLAFYEEKAAQLVVSPKV